MTFKELQQLIQVQSRSIRNYERLIELFRISAQWMGGEKRHEQNKVIRTYKKKLKVLVSLQVSLKKEIALKVNTWRHTQRVLKVAKEMK